MSTSNAVIDTTSVDFTVENSNYFSTINCFNRMKISEDKAHPCQTASIGCWEAIMQRCVYR